MNKIKFDISVKKKKKIILSFTQKLVKYVFYCMEIFINGDIFSN